MSTHTEKLAERGFRVECLDCGPDAVVGIADYGHAKAGLICMECRNETSPQLKGGDCR